MEFEESDYKLTIDGGVYVLYVLKNKKEFKEDSKTNFKFEGNFLELKYAIRAIISYRKGKKYPGKENYKDLIPAYLTYKKSVDKLKEISNLIYSPINKLQNKLIKYE